jgi:hypothetical protein
MTWRDGLPPRSGEQADPTCPKPGRGEQKRPHKKPFFDSLNKRLQGPGGTEPSFHIMASVESQWQCLARC